MLHTSHLCLISLSRAREKRGEERNLCSRIQRTDVLLYPLEDFSVQTDPGFIRLTSGIGINVLCLCLCLWSALWFAI